MINDPIKKNGLSLALENLEDPESAFPVEDQERWISQILISDMRRIADEVKDLRRELSEQKIQQELSKLKIHGAVVVVSFVVSLAVTVGIQYLPAL